jgi:hypothetical protein
MTNTFIDSIEKFGKNRGMKFPVKRTDISDKRIMYYERN